MKKRKLNYLLLKNNLTTRSEQFINKEFITAYVKKSRNARDTHSQIDKYIT